MANHTWSNHNKTQKYKVSREAIVYCRIPLQEISKDHIQSTLMHFVLDEQMLKLTQLQLGSAVIKKSKINNRN